MGGPNSRYQCLNSRHQHAILLGLRPQSRSQVLSGEDPQLAAEVAVRGDLVNRPTSPLLRSDTETHS